MYMEWGRGNKFDLNHWTSAKDVKVLEFCILVEVN